MIDEMETSPVETIETQLKENERRKSRINRFVLFFIVLGVVLTVSIVVAFLSLPKYQASQEVKQLQKVYPEIDRLSQLIQQQEQGANISVEVIKQQTERLEKLINALTVKDAKLIQTQWKNLKSNFEQLQGTLRDINELLQLRYRVDIGTKSLNQIFTNLSSEFSQSRSVSLETVRHIDVLSGLSQRLNANIYGLLSSQSNVDLQIISDMTDSLNQLQKALNVLRVGDPSEGIQGLQGLLQEEMLNEAQFIFNELANSGNYLIHNAKNIIILNELKQSLQKEKNLIQNVLQSSIDIAYSEQEQYINQTNNVVFFIAVIASIAIGFFFFLCVFIYYRINYSSRKVLYDKNKFEKQFVEVIGSLREVGALSNESGSIPEEISSIEDVSNIKGNIAQVVRGKDKEINTLKETVRNLKVSIEHIKSVVQLNVSELSNYAQIITVLNEESEVIVDQGKDTRQSCVALVDTMKKVKETFNYLAQAFSYDAALLKKIGIEHESINELKDTLMKQKAFFEVKNKESQSLGHELSDVETFFASVIKNLSDATSAYREVEKNLNQIISQLEQVAQ